MEPSLEKEFERYAGIHKLNAFFGIEIDMEADISGAIRSIAAAATLIQKATELAKKTKNSDLIDAIADLRMELAQAKIAAANTNEQIAELIKENHRLREELATALTGNKAKLIVGQDKLYYTPDGDGPFCTGCYDERGKEIRLVEQLGATSIFGKYRCPSCNKPFGSSKF